MCSCKCCEIWWVDLAYTQATPRTQRRFGTGYKVVGSELCSTAAGCGSGRAWFRFGYAVCGLRVLLYGGCGWLQPFRSCSVSISDETERGSRTRSTMLDSTRRSWLPIGCCSFSRSLYGALAGGRGTFLLAILQPGNSFKPYGWFAARLFVGLLWAAHRDPSVCTPANGCTATKYGLRTSSQQKKAMAKCWLWVWYGTCRTTVL